MKKLLQVSAVLIAAVLLFAGCKNNADDDSLPGKWKNDIQYYNGTVDMTTADAALGVPETAIGTVTWDGQGGAVYSFESPFDPYAGTKDALQQNHFFNYAYGFMGSQYSDLTGFDAVASCTSSRAPYGFYFNIHSESNRWTDYYELLFEGTAFRIGQKVNGEWTTLHAWDNATAINASPKNNNISVYKDGDVIKIKVNGTIISTIENPELTEGFIGFACAFSYDDIQNHTAVTSTYKINQVQYK